MCHPYCIAVATSLTVRQTLFYFEGGLITFFQLPVALCIDTRNEPKGIKSDCTGSLDGKDIFQSGFFVQVVLVVSWILLKVTKQRDACDSGTNLKSRINKSFQSLPVLKLIDSERSKS